MSNRSRFEIDQEEGVENSLSPLKKSLNSDTLNKKKTININNRIKAILAYMMFVFSICMVNVVCKIGYTINPDLNGFDYLLVRSISMLFISTIPLFINNVDIFDIKPGYRIMFFSVHILNCLAMTCVFNSLKYVATSIVVVPINTSPIFAAIIGVLVLKEIVNWKEALCIVGTFLGVICLLMGNSNSTLHSEYYRKIIAVVSGLYAAITFATSLVFLRSFNKVHNYLIFGFYYAVTLTLASGFILLTYPKFFNFAHYEIKSISCFVVSGIFSISHKTFSSYALKLEEASFLAPFMYLCPVVTFMFDIWLFGYEFSAIEIIGAVIIILFLLMKLKVGKTD